MQYFRLCSRIKLRAVPLYSLLAVCSNKFTFSCDTTFPLCSRFYGVPVKFTFWLAAQSSEERRLAAHGLVSVKRDRLILLGLHESRRAGLG